MPIQKILNYKKQKQTKEAPQENIIEYKGVHFEGNADSHYQDDNTGAHFEYIDLYNRLSILLYERNKTDGTTTTTSHDGRSLSREIQKTNQLPEFVVHENCIHKKGYIQAKCKSIVPPKNIDLSLSNNNILKNTIQKPDTQENKIRPITTKKNEGMMGVSKLKTIDYKVARILSPKQTIDIKKPSKTAFSDFNFRSLDNRKRMDTIPLQASTQYNHILNLISPKKSAPMKQLVASAKSRVII